MFAWNYNRWPYVQWLAIFYLFNLDLDEPPCCFRYSPLSGMMTRNHDSFSQPGVQTFSVGQSATDTIPIAIALTENIKSKFRGAEHESQVQRLRKN